MKNWFFRFFTSSIGQKLIMALSGLFLILFLVIHLAGNLQLLKNDGGEAFNVYAHFMAHNGLIQFVSKGNFAFILLHAIVGLGLWIKNGAARGAERYAVQKTRATATHPGFAKNMWILGVIIFIFILVHLWQFWLKMKMGDVAEVTVDGQNIHNLYAEVAVAFTNLPFVLFYVVSMIVIAFHLWHGFQSAFQTIGWSHPKYTPAIRFIGKAYSILIPLGFAVIPVIFYFQNA